MHRQGPSASKPMMEQNGFSLPPQDRLLDLEPYCFLHRVSLSENQMLRKHCIEKDCESFCYVLLIWRNPEGSE